MKTAGVTSPINGMKTPGSQLAANSLDIPIPIDP